MKPKQKTVSELTKLSSDLINYLFILRSSKMLNKQLEQMRAEDKAYGEQTKNRKSRLVEPRQKKNQPNFARYSVNELVQMRDEDMDDYDL